MKIHIPSKGCLLYTSFNDRLLSGVLLGSPLCFRYGALPDLVLQRIYTG